ncbi:MAG: hypothetical protein ACYTAF_00405 [Planctomycetota bacterium]|jgi:outer membrane biosynthesis protein TonB
MRIIAAAALLALLVSCGEGDGSPAAPPEKDEVVVVPPTKAPEPAPKEETEKPPEPPPKEAPEPPPKKEPEKPKGPPPVPFEKREGPAGKSTVAGLYACPVEGCTFKSARKETCLKHADTTLKELWFVCPKCKKEQIEAGKCAACGAETVRTLK